MPSTKRQATLPFESAHARGIAGMNLAASNADFCSPGWTALALERLRAYVATLPFDKDFIVEDVRLAIQADLPEVFELRAWGAVTKAAIRHQFFATTGRFMPAVSSNCSPKPVYRRGIGA